ncbi:MAG: hypothetical protein R6W68_13385 [Ignavibacteriaceae bacterium]
MNRLVYILITIILVIFLCAYLSFRQDDAYIFYSYAKNIAEGNGYVFNLGEKVNATTSPLYTLLLAALYLLIKPFATESLHVIGIIISVISILIVLLLMKKILADRKLYEYCALIFLCLPLLKFGFGMETFLNLALITASVYFFVQNKLIISSIFAGLSILARLDSVLFAGTLFLIYVSEYKKFPSLKVVFIFLITVLPWFIFSYFYFDSLLPTTIGVKLSQNQFDMHGTGLIFIKGFFSVLPGRLISAIFLMTGLIFSLVYLYRKKIKLTANPGIKIILIWSLLLFLIYAFILNAPYYQWYYTPFALSSSVLLSYTLHDLFNKDHYRKLIFILLFLIALILPLKTYYEGFNPKYINYYNAASWLNENIRDNSVLGVDEIGIMGYYYRKGRIIDALGLVTPEVVPHLSKKEFIWYIEIFSPDYIVNDFPIVQAHAGGSEKEFFDKYEMIKIFQARNEKIAIYKKRIVRE